MSTEGHLPPPSRDARRQFVDAGTPPAGVVHGGTRGANSRLSVALRLFAVAALLCAALASPGTLGAHPHVFIDARVTFRFDESELLGCEVEWQFDEMFTSMIVLDFDVPRDGDFSKEDIRTIEEGAFRNLRNYDYYTYFFVDGEKHPATEAREFTSFMRGGRIVYRFFVPFRHPIDAEEQRVRVRIYDETFFTDIAFQDHEPIAVEADAPLDYDYSVTRNEDVDIHYDPMNQSVSREDADYTGLAHPYEAELRFRRR